MTGPVFVDTNVLVYARDSRYPDKEARARHWLTELWTTRSGRLSMQVVQEFYVVVVHRLRPGLPPDRARLEARTYFAWRPLPLSATLVTRAWALQDRFGLSYWDSAILAAAHRLRCRYLLTEDLQAGQDLDGITVVNPFETEPASIR